MIKDVACLISNINNKRIKQIQTTIKATKDIEAFSLSSHHYHQFIKI
jgi:hypothetical protein